LAYNGSTFVAASGSLVATSSDGITWTQRTLAVTSVVAPHVAAAPGGIFVHAGYTAAPYYSIVQTSTDGITWTFRSVGWPQSYPTRLRYLNDRFYLGMGEGGNGNGGSLFTSTDGITWAENTAIKPYIPASYSSLWYDGLNNLVYVVGPSLIVRANNSGRAFAVSADNGVTWQGLKLGARISQTSTNSGFPPSNNIGSPNVYSALTADNKTVIAGA